MMFPCLDLKRKVNENEKEYKYKLCLEGPNYCFMILSLIPLPLIVAPKNNIVIIHSAFPTSLAITSKLNNIVRATGHKTQGSRKILRVLYLIYKT